jgi:hypothetical protein
VSGDRLRIPIHARDALLLALLALTLYTLTLAPTVLWSDDARLQRAAVEGDLHSSAGSHPLWVLIAHLFSKVPLGDAAGRVNMVSAVFAAATIGVVRLVLGEVGVGRYCSCLAASALAVSHTFWSHAVRAEAYTLTLAIAALLIWCALRWFRTGRAAFLLAGGLALGLGVAVHLIVLVYFPAVAWLVWHGRRRLSGKAIAGFALAAVVGASPLLVLLVRDALLKGMDAVALARWALFTFEGYDFSDSFFDFSLPMLLPDLLEWLAYLAIQFVGLAFFLGLVGAVVVWRSCKRHVAVYMLLLYIGAMAFAFAYRVGDRYVFYLPSYLPFVLWIGLGLQWGLEALRHVRHRLADAVWSRAALALLLLATPVAAYRLAPLLVERGLSFRDARRVPGPGSKYYFLWPPKAGYYDARVYAEQALDSAPVSAVLLAEPVLATPLLYLQSVEGRRLDVDVVYCCWGIDRVLDAAEGRPVLLVDTHPEIYPVEHLGEVYDIVPCGALYLLERR